MCDGVLRLARAPACTLARSQAIQYAGAHSAASRLNAACCKGSGYVARHVARWHVARHVARQQACCKGSGHVARQVASQQACCKGSGHVARHVAKACCALRAANTPAASRLNAAGSAPSTPKTNRQNAHRMDSSLLETCITFSVRYSKTVQPKSTTDPSPSVRLRRAAPCRT